MNNQSAWFANPNQRRLYYISIVLLLNTAGFLYYAYYLINNGYLPSPFIYDKSNTFMDWFNVMYWAYDDGRYTDWGSVYPPINFIIIKVVNLLCDGSVSGDAELMRDNARHIITAILLIYLTIPALVMRLSYWRKFTRAEKVLIYFTIVLSSPLLFTLERGNLILIAPLLLAIAISKIGFTRSLAIALLINIKPYFALTMIYYVARNNWKGFASCTLMSSLIFAISGLALDNHFMYFFANLLSFSQDADLFSLREVMSLPSSLSAISYVLMHPDGAMFASSALNMAMTSTVATLIETAKWGVLMTSLSILFTKSKQMRDVEIFALLVVMTSNLGIWVGGYTYILYIALIPIFSTMNNKLIYISILSLIAMPLDIVKILGDYIGEQYSYLASDHIGVIWTLGLGSAIRPIANILLAISLAHEFITRETATITRNNLFVDASSCRTHHKHGELAI